ncbi:ribbon-helix-helix protein, CopG family [Novosphingobium ginsenosidimutans]|uniref:Ribbon-helix-helix protein, CopG family n=1 Tax=Novosphingobium ginsenosidimutans TaxID=1176536 RepID=A0A5B8S0U0_9SPHN|nr:ribbon-helix-helix protein, CopG family [Novosphingobium ginsenosidimutans]QEA14754.1 ribbon-helix-helix protein, CopG family [Novosphingobium ginsenosidimutans]
MTRILADLPEEDIKWLDARAAEQGKSRASVLRDAVSAYKAQSPADGNKDWITRGAGLWKDRQDIADGVEYQRAIRQDRTPSEDL